MIPLIQQDQFCHICLTISLKDKGKGGQFDMFSKMSADQIIVQETPCPALLFDTRIDTFLKFKYFTRKFLTQLEKTEFLNFAIIIIILFLDQHDSEVPIPSFIAIGFKLWPREGKWRGIQTRGEKYKQCLYYGLVLKQV